MLSSRLSLALLLSSTLVSASSLKGNYLSDVTNETESGHGIAVSFFEVEDTSFSAVNLTSTNVAVKAVKDFGHPRHVVIHRSSPTYVDLSYHVDQDVELESARVVVFFNDGFINQMKYTYLFDTLSQTCPEQGGPKHRMQCSTGTTGQILGLRMPQKLSEAFKEKTVYATIFITSHTKEELLAVRFFARVEE